MPPYRVYDRLVAVLRNTHVISVRSYSAQASEISSGMVEEDNASVCICACVRACAGSIDVFPASIPWAYMGPYPHDV